MDEDQRKTFAQIEPVIHPLVMSHPVAGRRALYGVAGSAFEVLGLPAADGRALLGSLKQHATHPRFCTSYKLLPGDVLLWDNLSVIHRATLIEYSDVPGQRRLNYRISVRGFPDVSSADGAPRFK